MECTKCKQDKPISAFSKTGRGKGYTNSCKLCNNKKLREWKTPTHNRKYNLKKSFNITLEEYNVILDAQNGKCAICNQEETTVRAGKVQALSVDHDHLSGKIRGLLCNSCNRALGKFKDNINNLLSAVEYLRKYK